MSDVSEDDRDLQEQLEGDDHILQDSEEVVEVGGDDYVHNNGDQALAAKNLAKVSLVSSMTTAI